MPFSKNKNSAIPVVSHNFDVLLYFIFKYSVVNSICAFLKLTCEVFYLYRKRRLFVRGGVSPFH